MSTRHLEFKGKSIEISDGHPDAVISVDGRDFAVHHHHADGGGLDMWMCDEAYFASPDIDELARHFAEYGYMFDDPGRVVVDETGAVANRPAKRPAKKKAVPKKRGGSHGGGH